VGLASRPAGRLDHDHVRGQPFPGSCHLLRRGGTPALIAHQQAFIVSPLAPDRAVTNRMPGGILLTALWPGCVSPELSDRACRGIGPDGHGGAPLPSWAVG
jgi:hypothetical protein